MAWLRSISRLACSAPSSMRSQSGAGAGALRLSAVVVAGRAAAGAAAGRGSAAATPGRGSAGAAPRGSTQAVLPMRSASVVSAALRSGAGRSMAMPARLLATCHSVWPSCRPSTAR